MTIKTVSLITLGAALGFAAIPAVQAANKPADNLQLICSYVPATTGATSTPATYQVAVFEASANVTPPAAGASCATAINAAQTAGYALIGGPLSLGNNAVLYYFKAKTAN